MLYNSIYWADDEMLINHHVYGVAAAYAPVLHLRRHGDDDVFGTYVASFERVWSSSRPLAARPSSGQSDPVRLGPSGVTA